MSQIVLHEKVLRMFSEWSQMWIELQMHQLQESTAW